MVYTEPVDQDTGKITELYGEHASAMTSNCITRHLKNKKSSDMVSVLGPAILLVTLTDVVMTAATVLLFAMLYLL